MRTLFLCGLGLLTLAIPSPAFALRIAMPSYNTGQKSAMAQAVVTGKVTGIEKDRVELEMYPGSKEKGLFQIAILKVDTALIGAKDLTHIKVAFGPVPVDAAPMPNGPATGARPFRPVMGPVALTEGQEGIFFLMPHTPGSTVMKVPTGFDPIAASAANYKDELANVKATTAVLADPAKAMKAEKLADRHLAATVLAAKFATPPFEGGPVEQVALDDELSQAILKTILEIDWKADPAGDAARLSGPMLASRWGLTPGSPLGIPKYVPKPGQDYNTGWKQTLETWAKANGNKVTLKKYVAKTK